MAGNLFSRLGPGKDERTHYDQLADDDVDIENRAGLALDEDNLAHQFHDDDLGHLDGLALHDSRVSAREQATPARKPRSARSQRGGQDSRWLQADDDGDNEVPASLLVEPHMFGRGGPRSPEGLEPLPTRQGGVPGPSTRRARAQWETAQVQQRLHHEQYYPGRRGANPPAAYEARRLGLSANPKEKAMFRWANVVNLDIFINDVYNYYLGAGIWCILLERFLHLVYVFFHDNNPRARH